MKFRIAVLALCGALALASGAYARGDQPRQVAIEARMLEVGGVAGINYSALKMKGEDKSDKTTTINIKPIFGYFLTDNFEIELDPILSLTSYKPGSTGKTITTTHVGGLAGGAFNFMTDTRTVPFALANVGFLTNSYTDAVSDEKKLSLILPDVGVGVKAMVSDNGAIRMELFVRNTLNEDGMKDMNNFQIGVRAGVTIFTGPM